MPFAAKVSDVPKWEKKVVHVDGKEVLLINGGGRIFACENECPHQGSPMQGGLVKDATTLTCPRHGYKFDLVTGACKDFPDYTLTVYPVTIDGDDILVDFP